MLQSKLDPLNYAIYTQLCTDGQFKAIIVIVFSVVLILLVGIICCCTNRRIEKELRKLEKEATGVQTRHDAEFTKITGFKSQISPRRNTAQKPVFDASMQDNTKPVTGRLVELSEHSSFISEQSQAKNNKSGRSGGMTPTRSGKLEKLSMIIG
jgi:hypothetical protein